MSSAASFNQKTYFFVMKTLDKCSIMMKPIVQAEYDTLCMLYEQDLLIAAYQDGSLFNDDEEMQDYFLGSNSELDEELEPTQILEQEEQPVNPYEELTNDLDLDAFFDLSDLPDVHLD